VVPGKSDPEVVEVVVVVVILAIAPNLLFLLIEAFG